jgi:nucleotide-binding universal stress UspA family protein
VPLFNVILHPTDLDESSKEAFRIARSLAQALGAKLVVFQVVPPPAALTPDGRVVLDPKDPEPVDLWAEYRTLAADVPNVAVSYAVVVGDRSEARRMLEDRVRQAGEGVLLVMGTYGRTGISRLIWGNEVEKVVRDPVCPVLVVKGS